MALNTELSATEDMSRNRKGSAQECSCNARTCSRSDETVSDLNDRPPTVCKSVMPVGARSEE